MTGTTIDTDLSGRHLVIAVPAYTGTVSTDFQDAMIRTINLGHTHGVKVTVSTRVRSALIDKVRDEMVHAFLTRTDGTDLLFIDSDVIWNPEDVMRLLVWTKARDFVVGPYCTKEEEPSFYYDLMPNERGKVIQDDQGLVRIKSCPGGFNMMTRAGLDRTVAEFEDMQYVAHRGDFKGETLTALHMMYLKENPDGTRSRIGEDIAFSRRWLEACGQIWMDPTIQLKHIGEKQYSRSYVEWLSSRQEGSSESPVVSTDAKHGTFCVPCNDTFVGASMRKYGEWAEEEVQTLTRFLCEGDAVVDVGAYIGSHTVPFSRSVGRTGKVYAFEAQAQAYECLASNIDNTNTEAVRAVVSDYAGKVSLARVNTNQPGNYGALSIDKLTAKDGATVAVVRLDDEIPLDAKVCLIKVDVEGMERHVLRGAHATIARCAPVLFVEHNRAKGTRELIETIETVIGDTPYHFFWHIAPYYNPGNHRGDTENIFATYRQEANILAVPSATVCSLLTMAGWPDIWPHIVRYEEGDKSWRDALPRMKQHSEAA